MSHRCMVYLSLKRINAIARQCYRVMLEFGWIAHSWKIKLAGLLLPSKQNIYYTETLVTHLCNLLINVNI